jgi:hypothetical protein
VALPIPNCPASLRPHAIRNAAICPWVLGVIQFVELVAASSVAGLTPAARDFHSIRSQLNFIACELFQVEFTGEVLR